MRKNETAEKKAKTNKTTKTTKNSTRKKQTPSESVKLLVEEFHSKWEAGLTISEISKLYGVEISTTYKKLEEIAKANGVAREYYLVKNQKKHAEFQHGSRAYEKFDEDSVKRLENSFGRILTEIRDIKDTVDITLKENEAYQNKITSEEEISV